MLDLVYIIIITTALRGAGDIFNLEVEPKEEAKARITTEIPKHHATFISTSLGEMHDRVLHVTTSFKKVLPGVEVTATCYEALIKYKELREIPCR